MMDTAALVPQDWGGRVVRRRRYSFFIRRDAHLSDSLPVLRKELGVLMALSAQGHVICCPDNNSRALTLQQQSIAEACMHKFTLGPDDVGNLNQSPDKRPTSSVGSGCLPTLTQRCELFYNPTRSRRITACEALLAQGFPAVEWASTALGLSSPPIHIRRNDRAWIFREHGILWVRVRM